MSSLHFKLGVLLAALAATTLQAAERPSVQPGNSAAAEAAARSLSPAQINAIRAIGRGVLAAKKSGVEDAADAEQLSQLRASLDRVIAADLEPQNRSALTAHGQGGSEKAAEPPGDKDGDKKAAHEQGARSRQGLRESARADARSLASQLKNRGEWQASRLRAMPQDDILSAGMPIGKQRAQLFERWASKLNTALADDGPDRQDQLLALREQLRGARGRPSATPMGRGTPTLKAMPAVLHPPRNAKASKKSGN